MFTKKQLEPPTDKQLGYINSLEKRSGLTFNGKTKREAIKFIDHATQTIFDKMQINCELERENERFPFPNLKDDLPSDKQWDYIRSLEKKTKVKFQGITKKDAMIYIDYAKGLVEGD